MNLARTDSERENQSVDRIHLIGQPRRPLDKILAYDMHTLGEVQKKGKPKKKKTNIMASTAPPQSGMHDVMTRQDHTW